MILSSRLLLNLRVKGCSIDHPRPRSASNAGCKSQSTIIIRIDHRKTENTENPNLQDERLVFAVRNSWNSYDSDLEKCPKICCPESNPSLSPLPATQSVLNALGRVKQILEMEGFSQVSICDESFARREDDYGQPCSSLPRYRSDCITIRGRRDENRRHSIS